MTTTETTDAVLVECPSCGQETDRALRIKAQYVGTPSELPESPMCLSCVLGWPVSMRFLGATKDGVLILKHHSVIGEWTPET